ncbi:MAG TPA: hypothetical protein VF021_07155 [Longimicrobiales bacterium]
MLLTTLRKEGRAPHSRFKAVTGAVAASFFDGDADGFTESEARVIEGNRLLAIDVGPAQPSAFSAFLDGIQRADIKLQLDTVPIVYAFGAAVIRERHERQMRTLRRDGAELLSEREALFFPSQHVARAEVRPLVRSDEELIDTTPHGAEPLPLFPPLLYARAKHAMNRWRESLERELALRWCRQTEGWLLIDGSLTISPVVAGCERAVGLIKSHRTRFFDGDDARVILALKSGQRTSVFEPKVWQATPVRSWYLRLRPADGRDAFWGLVRVEMATSHDPAMAHAISQWLLAEVTPLSLPDARWDRLIYPIHDCEEFLRARAPRL